MSNNLSNGFRVEAYSENSTSFRSFACYTIRDVIETAINYYKYLGHPVEKFVLNPKENEPEYTYREGD